MEKVEKKIYEYIKTESFLKCSVLTEEAKHVVTLHLKDNLNYVEISRRIGKSAQMAKVIFTKAIKMLRLSLNEKHSDLLIEDSLLSNRVKNSFFNDPNIKTLKDFDKLPISKILRRNLGQASVLEIQKYIEDLGLSLAYPEQETIFILPKNFNKDLFADFSPKDLIRWINNLGVLLQKRII
jgi:hypothetical protein